MIKAIAKPWKRPGDYRTAASRAAEARVVALCEAGTVLGLGGGPIQAHPRIINLNIAAHSNVAIVGDAHRLPLRDNCLDAAHCEAVFEHLEDPGRAAAELFRIMKPGAIAYVCTPFLQPFHGYPSHYQNFTQAGHERLFARAGFRLEESGVAVGPAWAVATLVATFLARYAPRFLHWPARALWYAFSHLFVRPMDIWLASRSDAHVLASTTYVLIAKPALA